MRSSPSQIFASSTRVSRSTFRANSRAVQGSTVGESEELALRRDPSHHDRSIGACRIVPSDL